MARARRQYVVTVSERPVTCLACGADRFTVERRIRLGTVSVRTATGLVCATCGLVQHYVRPAGGLTLADAE